ncbi:MAG: LemA family protein [Fibrobacter sp.]|nr:LemA family protein [Fibrobacter sp.]
MKKVLIILGVIVLLLAALVGQFVGIYNEIIELEVGEKGVKTVWANVETQYQRRFDLVPQLVNTLEAQANFEKSTLKEVTDARSRMGGSIKIDENMLNDEQAMKKFQEVQATLGGALQRLMAISENYPELKSNQGFSELRIQLEGTENRIAVARRDYNEVVGKYNAFIRKFPNSLVAGFAGAAPKVPFAADVAASTAPKVDINIK